MIVADVVLAALKTRLTEQGIIGQVTSFTWGPPAERTAVPYVYIDTVTERRNADTNTSRIKDGLLTVNVYHNTREECAALLRLIDNAINFAPLLLDVGMNSILFQDAGGTGRFLDEDYFTHGVKDYVATVQGSANYHPA